MAQLRVVPCPYQSPESRYPSDIKPKVARYRNNLTALSQYANLLFIAYTDRIHIFSLEFPHQTLSKEPKLIIDLPKSRSARPGHLDLSCPHAVNHLMVGDLGNEEVLVAACDDGDVISYTIRAIELTIERSRPIDVHQTWPEGPMNPSSSSNYTPRSSTFPDPKPWFLENVGHSAWGLAVHKQARLLAISSNTQIIDVFAPALRSLRREVSGAGWKGHHVILAKPSMGVEEWKTSRCFFPSTRASNLRILLGGHTTNIPNIAFAGGDHDGRYLASTDIEANTFIWDIYSGKTIFRSQDSSSQSLRGWNVACLDPLSSRLTVDARQTFGCDVHTDNKSTFIDVSGGCHSIPDNSHWHPAFARYGGVTSSDIPQGEHDMLSSDEDEEILESDPESDGSESGIESQAIASATNQGQDFFAHQNPDPFEMQPPDSGPYPIIPPHYLSHQIPLSHTGNGENMLIGLEHAAIEDVGDPVPEFLVPPDVDPDMFNYETFNYNTALFPLEPVLPPYDTESLVADEHYHGQVAALELVNECKRNTRRPNNGQAAVKGPATARQLPFNLLQTSESDICLFRNIPCASTREAACTRVVSRQTLLQKMPPGLRHLSQIERLNMLAQIPELGVVIIGNQVGRVGVLTATHWQGARQSGYRVDAILPFKSQEEAGLRPEKALMGMAVGPLQGHEYRPDPESSRGGSQEKTGTERPVSLGSSRRFRLLLIYQDHTVLSYEISRQSEGDILVT